MTSHEKAIKLISDLGISAKKIGEIIGKSQSVVYDKIKEYRSNRFLDEDFSMLLKHCEKSINELK
jgi:transposase